MINHKSATKSGAVSIFMVVFMTLLISVLTFGFVRLMLRDQRESILADLSQSAYDSAMAGVEDAKRAITRYSANCVNVVSPASGCDVLKENFFKGNSCDVISKVLDNSDVAKERLIQTTTSSDEYLDQAYTCVRINYDTPDFLGQLESDSAGVTIPLRSDGAIKKVEISWFTKENNGNKPDLDLSSDLSFPDAVGWPENRPPLIIAQYFHLADTNSKYDINGDAFRTVYLYPQNIGAVAPKFLIDDSRGVDSIQFAPIVASKCINPFNSETYACSITLELPDSNSKPMFLRLTKRYGGKTDFQVKPFSALDAALKFSGVQPAIDSTGRANDQFRRVEARVESASFASVPLPSAAVEIDKGNFCKSLQVDIDNSTNGC